MTRSRRAALRGALAIFALTSIVSACGGSGASAASSAGPSVDPNTPRIAARDLKFTQAAVTVPAAQAFSLVFENQEDQPHNMAILDSANKAVFTGDVVKAGSITYSVPALAAGRYGFVCSIHADMTGTMTAR